MIIGQKSTRCAVRANERGAILVTSLLLLLVLTIIGVSVMQMTRMQERMSGNSRDSNVAFQGAESSLRSAETKILAFPAAPVACSSVAPCATVFAKKVLPVLNAQNTGWWDTNATAFTVPEIASQFKYSPQFVIEQVAFVPFTKEFGEITGRDFYQVTGRSTGDTGSAESVVQSTFARVAQ